MTEKAGSIIKAILDSLEMQREDLENEISRIRELPIVEWLTPEEVSNKIMRHEPLTLGQILALSDKGVDDFIDLLK